MAISEGLHAEFAGLACSLLQNELPVVVVPDFVEGVVTAEGQLIWEVLP